MTPTCHQLRAARAWLGLGRRQVAHGAGVYHETLARAERGQPTVSADSLDAISAFYNTRGFVWCGTSGLARRSPS